MQWVTGDYKRLQEITGGYKESQGLQGVKGGKGVTRGYGGLQWVTGG